eukprot:426067_1
MSDAIKVKSRLNLVIVGHFESGKSTTIGRLIFDEQNVTETISNNNNKYANYMHKGKEEKKRGHSIHGTAGFVVETNSYHYSIFDAPGYKQYIKNMIRAAACSDVALMIISADNYPKSFDESITKTHYKNGIQIGGTRHHAQICYALGITRMIICINKIDTIKSTSEQKTIYDEIIMKTTRILNKTGYNTKKIAYIPISALHDYNLTIHNKNVIPWYNGFTIKRKKQTITGFTLIDALEKAISIPKRRSIYKPFRMQISRKHDIPNIGLVTTGIVQQGTITSELKVHLYPNTQKTKKIAITGSLEMHHNKINIAKAGDQIGIQLHCNEKIINMINSGDVILIKQDNGISAVKASVLRFSAMIHVRFLYKIKPARFQPITRNYYGDWRYAFKSGYCSTICVQNSRAVCQLIEIRWRKTASTGYKKTEYNPDFIGFDDTAEVVFKVLSVNSIALTSYKEYGPLGRIIGIDHNEMMFYGKVLDVIDDMYYKRILVGGYIRQNSKRKMKKISSNDMINLMACYVDEKFIYDDDHTIFDYDGIDEISKKKFAPDIPTKYTKEFKKI